MKRHRITLEEVFANKKRKIGGEDAKDGPLMLHTKRDLNHMNDVMNKARDTICETLLDLRMFRPLGQMVADYALVRGDIDVWCSGQSCHLLTRVFEK